jgi:uncharacterized protein (DUF1684 family)
MTSDDLLDLLDWKRRVFDLYRDVRAEPDPAAAWGRWRRRRDELFAKHPQSPLTDEGRARFGGLDYFDYDSGARALAEVNETPAQRYDITTSGDGEPYAFTRFATAGFQLRGQRLELELYWLEGYGGGLFLPFRDATSGQETYGAGRYLLDTVKGADLGMQRELLVLDFNFAYNPSCAYDPLWVCPLAPPPNRLSVEVRAGEKAP